MAEIEKAGSGPTAQFRFYADFEVDLDPRKVAKLTPQQQRMLQAISSSAASIHEVARLSLVTDLAGLTGRHFDGVFQGPSDEEILASILPWLSAEDRAYWQELPSAPSDALAFELMPVFLVLRTSLVRAGVDGLGPFPDAHQTKVGPTIEGKK